MPLLSLWLSNPSAVTSLSVEQIVATAGDGRLRDASECASEFREYLTQVTSSKLTEYAEYCLSSSFNKSGMVLQDLVNELGRRLDYKVTNGRYQGTVSTIGFDGLWHSPENHDIVVEVKTTDAYRISFDTIAEYRRKLITEGKVGQNASILIVVGREDTGELEAQVRGSRYAWDIRLISVDALSNLVSLKENTDSTTTSEKIRSVLVPREYTKLDALIDVMFSTARDVETVVEIENSLEEASESGSGTSKWEFTDSAELQKKERNDHNYACKP